MLRDRAGQVSEESKAAESGILPRLTNPLSGVTRKERLYLLGTSAIGITTIVFTGLILLRWASSQRKGERSAKRSKTRCVLHGLTIQQEPSEPSAKGTSDGPAPAYPLL